MPHYSSHLEVLRRLRSTHAPNSPGASSHTRNHCWSSNFSCRFSSDRLGRASKNARRFLLCSTARRQSNARSWSFVDRALSYSFAISIKDSWDESRSWIRTRPLRSGANPPIERLTAVLVESRISSNLARLGGLPSRREETNRRNSPRDSCLISSPALPDRNSCTSVSTEGVLPGFGTTSHHRLGTEPRHDCDQ